MNNSESFKEIHVYSQTVLALYSSRVLTNTLLEFAHQPGNDKCFNFKLKLQ